MEQRVVAVIPARMASSRFPGKPLVTILDLPMIEHVWRRVALCDSVDEVVVATCDAEIFDVVEGFGGRAVMTADTHERCTTRVQEAMASLDGEIVVIVQGDEPLLVPSVIDRVVAPFQQREEVGCTNLLSRIADRADLDNPDIVKAATDQAGYVMLFSRAAIPHFRHPSECPIYRQTGIMGFRTPVLHRFTSLSVTPFERAESVDMLRLLEHGYRILGVPIDQVTVGVDRPEDVARVENILRSDPLQQMLMERAAADR